MSEFQFYYKQNPSQTFPVFSKGVPHTGARTMAAELKKMVDEEITADNCFVTPTAQFLEKLFPVQEDSIEKIYKELVANKSYNEKTKRWPNMPKARTKSETKYYAPFTKISTAITTAAEKLNHTPELRCIWLDRHDKPPASTDGLMALVRPDCLASLATQEDVDTLEKRIGGAAKDLVSSFELKLYNPLISPSG